MEEASSEKSQTRDPSKTIEDEIQLGDTLIIIGGKYDKTQGKVYFKNDEMIHIMPLGLSNRIIELPSTVEDIEELKLEKGFPHSFVALQDFRVRQIVEALKDGELVNTYVVNGVNEKEDSVVLVDNNQEEFTIEFNFTGIPLDSPYDVLRGTEAPKEISDNDVAEEIEQLEEEEGPEGDEEEEEFIEFTRKVIELEREVLTEIPSSKRNYPDSVQRADMLQEFIKGLELKSQKNENKLRSLRRLVELCLLMRNEIIQYDNNGEPNHIKHTTYNNVLDMVKSHSTAISRPVVDCKRVLYLDHVYVKDFSGNTNDEKDDPLTIPNNNLSVRYLDDEIRKENEINFVGDQNVDTTNQLPNWYMSWNKYNKNNFLSWSEKDKEGKQSFTTDKEFFRAPISDMEDKNVDGLPLIPFHIEDIRDPQPLTTEYIGSVGYSILKGLKGRMGRLKGTEEKQMLEQSEEAVIQSYLLFPKSYERELGTIRSGKLSYDIGFSLKNPNLMKDILEDGIPLAPTTGSIIAVGAEGNTTGNIYISDWLDYTPLILYGLGDALIELSSYGLSQKEFSFEQQKVLVKKIESTVAHVKSHIKYSREKEGSQEKKEVVLRNFVNEERFNKLMDRLSTQGILINLITKILAFRTPLYKNNDTAIFAFLYNEVQDLLLSTLGDSILLALYKTKYVEQTHIQSFINGFRLKMKNDDKLFEPVPNHCNHVKSLDVIRKVKDDSDRMKLLSKYLIKFQAYKKNNFIYCILCDKHCLCNHEYLLLQEYLHPKEKDTIHKEILLTFSGGVFQGKYICNNCGQAISSLDFDNSLEYDDDGKPMSGRAVLVDKEAMEEEEINLALGAPVENVEEIQFETKEKTLYYQTIKAIFDSVGIFPSGKSYIEMVNSIDDEMKNQQTRDQYIKKNKGIKTALPYDTYINYIIIGVCATFSIIEIQTHIPSYVPRYNVSGCVADFRGYPLGDPTDKRIIEYISCLIARIENHNDPWEKSGIFNQPDIKKRQKKIEDLTEKVMKNIIINSNVMTLLIKKKAYMKETYGQKGITQELKESTIHGFTPRQMALEDEVIVTKAAQPVDKIRGIIYEANKSAKESMKKDIINPTCCAHRINEPLGFWKEKEIQTINSKSVPKGPINSHSSFNYKIQKEAKIIYEITKEEYNQLFLQVCYKGDFIGRSHQFGYNNICFHCELDISPIKDIDFKEQITSKKLQEEQQVNYNSVLESLLREQGIEVTDVTFKQLLNTVHEVNSVVSKPIYLIRLHKVTKETYDILFTLNPSPFEDWKELINNLFASLEKLDVQQNALEPYNEISSRYRQYMNAIKGYIGERNHNFLERMLEQPIQQMVDSIRSSLLINLQRVLKGFNTEALVIQKSYGFKSNDNEDEDLRGIDFRIVDDIKNMLKTHTNYLRTMTERVTGVGKSKIEYGVERLSKILNAFQKSIRGPMLPGGSTGVDYILKAAISGVLYEMMNQNMVAPDGYSEEDTVLDTSALPKEIISELIIRYESETFRLTEEEIKLAIAVRNEKEKMLFINKLDKLSPEEKRLELIQKKLGLGDWSRGGTKSIYAYNSEQYEFERNQRAEMGLRSQSQIDKYNLLRDEQGMDSGYDNQQINPDDY
jgi:hypothetical protein